MSAESKLFVIGDSFSDSFKTENFEHIPDLWPVHTAKLLGCSFLINYSRSGVSQDYCWSSIEDYLDQMTEDDYLIVILTDFLRQWFIKDQPYFSNIRVGDKGSMLGIESQYLRLDKSLIKSIEYYYQYLQWDEIDLQKQNYRLGWLHDQISRRKLRNPLIIQGFDNQVNENDWPLFHVSKGNLTFDVQSREFDDSVIGWMYKDFSEYRYNHLVLSNHKILSEKILETFNKNEKLDLTTGFKQRIIKGTAWQSDSFFKKELNFNIFNERFNLKGK